MIFLWALIASAGAPTAATAATDVSLFFRDAARIEREGNFDCAARPIGQRLKSAAGMCGSSLEEWRRFAMGLIEIPAYPHRGMGEGKLKAAVARNIRISEAYAQLYLYSLQQKPVCGRSVLPWVGGASLGSLKSGQLMRSGLSEAVGGIPAFDQITDANYRDRFAERFGPLLKGYALRQATLTLGEGNLAIYTDLYWQLLAAAACGPDETLRAIHATEGWREDKKLARAAEAFSILARGSAACDHAEIKRANLVYVEVEQYFVGQAAMYEGLTRQFGGWMLSPLIESAVPDALGFFPDFNSYAKKRDGRFPISFADPGQRVPWMQDQLAVMDKDFTEKQAFLPKLYCAVAQDSERAEAVIQAL